MLNFFTNVTSVYIKLSTRRKKGTFFGNYAFPKSFRTNSFLIAVSNVSFIEFDGKSLNLSH